MFITNSANTVTSEKPCNWEAHYQECTLREKCPNTEFFTGPYFPLFGLNTGKYGPEKKLRIWLLFTQW